MERGLQVTFDAGEPHQLARWWAGLLGYAVEDNHARVTTLLEQGVVTDADVVEIDGRRFFKDAVAATDPNGGGPRLLFLRVPEAKSAKNRVHLDIPVEQADLDVEVERVAASGATLVGFNSNPGQRWAVMQDPEGNEFCLH